MRAWIKFVRICLITGFFACNDVSDKSSESSSISCELNTEGLDESKGSHIFKCGNKEYKYEFQGIYSEEQALFGKGSILLNKQHLYGTNLVLDDLKEGEYIEVSIWRHDASGNASLVVQESSVNFYLSEKEFIQIGKNGWKKIVISFFVPENLKSATIYSFLANSNSAYFDGLKVIRSDQKPVSEHSSASITKLFFSPKNKNKLNEKRNRALELGVNISDGEWVSGIMVFNNSAMPVKARLKGDWLDHLNGQQWSFRIKVKDDYTFNRMKIFSIHHPKARYYLHEYVSHLLFNYADILTTRYGFTYGVINNQPVGLYAWEEHFTKQIIEYNLRREGPILKFDEDPMWICFAYLGIDQKENFPPFYDASKISYFGNIDHTVDTIKSKQFAIGHKLMHQYKYQYGNISDIFDIKKLAKYYAILDFIQGTHGKAWHNQRLYYNPVICKLEPINFDNFSSIFNPKQSQELIYKLYQDNDIISDDHSMSNRQFGDSTFLNHYQYFLQSFVDSKLTESFLRKYQDSISKYDNIVREEFPAFAYDFNFLSQRAEDISRKLPELNQHVSDKKYEQYSIHKKEQSLRPINIKEVLPSFINSYYYFNKGKSQILLENYNTIDIEVLGIANKGKKMLFSFEKPISLKAYTNKVDPIQIEVPSLDKAMYIAFKTTESDDILFSEITPWEKATGLSPYQQIKRDFDLSRSSLFKVQGDSLIISGKNNVIDNKVLVPSHKKVFIEAGTEIDIIKQGSFISHAPIFSLGTENNPVLIHSSDSSANGFVVLQANEKSTLNYTYFKHLNTLNYKGWTLTGAVNFYESDVDLNYCQFISNHCEDALNIIRSHFNVDHASFSHIYADAFDSDFCTGLLSNSNFQYVDNDAIDFSTSQITISDCYISDISDKGISGGEESTLKVFNTTILNCNIGAASKDLSNVELNNVSIKDCTYGLVALRKKPEYGAATLVTKELTMEGCKTEELIELNSVLIREGKEKKGFRKNVAAMFY